MYMSEGHLKNSGLLYQEINNLQGQTQKCVAGKR